MGVKVRWIRVRLFLVNVFWRRCHDVESVSNSASVPLRRDQVDDKASRIRRRGTRISGLEVTRHEQDIEMIHERLSRFRNRGPARSFRIIERLEASFINGDIVQKRIRLTNECIYTLSLVSTGDRVQIIQV